MVWGKMARHKCMLRVSIYLSILQHLLIDGKVYVILKNTRNKISHQSNVVLFIHLYLFVCSFILMYFKCFSLCLISYIFTEIIMRVIKKINSCFPNFFGNHIGYLSEPVSCRLFNQWHKVQVYSIITHAALTRQKSRRSAVCRGPGK